MFGDKDAERFFAKVHKTDGCWEWTAGKDLDGYGSFWFRGKNVGAHRWSYEHHKGTVPPGMEVDHLCHNPSCVRPDHLEAVSGAENKRRGYSPSAITARAGVCKRGHLLTPDNLFIGKDGRRRCKACKNARNRRYMSSYVPEHREQKQAYDKARHARLKGESNALSALAANS